MITQKQALQYVRTPNRWKIHRIGYSYDTKDYIPYKLQTIRILLSDLKRSYSDAAPYDLQTSRFFLSDSKEGYSNDIFEIILRNKINTEKDLKRAIDGACDAVLAMAVESFDLPVFALIHIFERVKFDKGRYYWFRKQSDYNDLPLYIINEIEGYFGCT